MSRVRFFRSLVAVAVGIGCGQETFELLPESAAPAASSAAGQGAGGRRDAGLPPHCPPGERGCRGCFTTADCFEHEACDPFGHYCATACNNPFDCPESRPLCHQARGTCVQCVFDTDCRQGPTRLVCNQGTCTECSANFHCPEFQPVCDDDDGRCRSCRLDLDCGGFGLRCVTGRCVPSAGPPPQQSPG